MYPKTCMSMFQQEADMIVAISFYEAWLMQALHIAMMCEMDFDDYRAMASVEGH